MSNTVLESGAIRSSSYLNGCYENNNPFCCTDNNSVIFSLLPLFLVGKKPLSEAYLNIQRYFVVTLNICYYQYIFKQFPADAQWWCCDSSMPVPLIDLPLSRAVGLCNNQGLNGQHLRLGDPYAQLSSQEEQGNIPLLMLWAAFPAGMFSGVQVQLPINWAF